MGWQVGALMPAEIRGGTARKVVAVGVIAAGGGTG